jgi:hypothetical protein
VAIDIPKLIAFLEELNPHNVYVPSYIVKELVKCGVDALPPFDSKSIEIGGKRVEIVEAEWGEPGISPLAVLSILFELISGSQTKSQMVGRGFWYRDVLSQIKKENP